MRSKPITTPRLILRNIGPGDVRDRYLEWLRDPEVNRYLEVRFQNHTEDSVKSFIESVNESNESILFGIFLADGNRHIGNIKLGPINRHHHRAEIGLLLGERAEWGKGYASEAIRAVSEFGFDELGLHKISAGCYERNTGSLHAFRKAGYKQEAYLPDFWDVDGEFQAQLWLGIVRAEDAMPVKATVTFGDVRSLTFIGGGALMVATGLYAKSLGYELNAVFAPRHAAEQVDGGHTAESALRTAGANVIVEGDINGPSGLAKLSSLGAKSLALCFGPAWVFSDEVIACFDAGMFNFNGIPIPHYLGGAHYTWQILNGNRKGGCFLQAITSRVDQGDVLRYEYFDLPPHVRVPKDYFDANFGVGVAFLSRVLDDMKNGVVFERTPYEGFNSRRLYFPRLFTKENAYIDWRWNGLEIERFCNAFDKPYPGAATFWRGQEVRLRGAAFTEHEECVHPFVSGLVVRRHAGQIWIAVRDGLLGLASVTGPTGESLVARMREGDRLTTPDERLWNSVNYSAKFNSQGIAS